MQSVAMVIVAVIAIVTSCRPSCSILSIFNTEVKAWIILLLKSHPIHHAQHCY